MFHEAQRVSLRLQSAHSLFSGCLTSARRMRAFASVSARDCVFLLAYDMMSTNRHGALDATTDVYHVMYACGAAGAV